MTIQAEGITFSSDVIQMCMEKNIPVHFLDSSGLSYAVLIDRDHPSVENGLAQLRAYENGKGAKLAAAFAEGKLRNQMALIKFIVKSGARSNPLLALAGEAALLRMEPELRRIREETPEQPMDALRGAIMAHEGRAAGAYWDFFKEALGEKAVFPGRKPQEANDVVNMSLNYGYGILYARVQNALARAGLYLHMAYLHSPGDAGRPSLAFDLIEEFRPQAVDRMVYAWLKREGPIKIKGEFLSPEQRNALAKKVIERLSRAETFDGKKLPLEDHIQGQARRLAAYLRGEIPQYKPYVGKW
ncbi:MAG: CRISPR-associated endonuclease Cas1 [Bacteroidia bacterium]